jgi:hypothetical protein
MHSKVETTPPDLSIGAEEAVDTATKQTDMDATVMPTTELVLFLFILTKISFLSYHSFVIIRAIF